MNVLSLCAQIYLVIGVGMQPLVWERCWPLEPLEPKVTARECAGLCVMVPVMVLCWPVVAVKLWKGRDEHEDWD
jgi:hypothetical protein